MKTKLLMCATLAIMACVSGCKDDIVPEKQQVETSVQCSSGREVCYAYVELQQATEAILPVTTNQEWFSIEDVWMDGLLLSIKVGVEQNNTGKDRVGQVVLPLTNGTNVQVTINQSSNDAIQNTKENEKFIAHWYKMKDFYLANLTNIYTPWSGKTQSTSVPINITREYKPEHGWEVVFIDNCMASLYTARCYFGLYNRYMGKLRVYTYTDVTKGSSEYMVRYHLDNYRENIRYAYHSLPVGIPVDCTIDTDKAFTSGERVTFQNFTVPYNQVGAPLGLGWKAFDIDLSSYSPTNKFYTEKVLLDITFLPTSVGVFKAEGQIQGTITGSFTNPKDASMSYTGGMIETVGDVLGRIGEGASGLSNIFSKSFTPVGMAFKCGGVIASMAGAILDLIPPSGQEYTAGHPGTIELKTQQKITLDGQFITPIASEQPPVTLSERSFVKKQPYDNGHEGNRPYIGEGVWSLVTTPTYYIVDDVMLGSANKVHFEPTGKNDQYYSTIENSENVRMVSFFDPTSVQVNINPNIFKDSTAIDTVEVFTSPVVVLDQPTNYYTDEYYKLIYGKGIERNMPICTKHMTYYANQPFSGNEHRVKYYMRLPVKETDTDTTSVSIYEKDKPYGLRGVVSECKGINRKVIIDPEILYKPNDNTTSEKTCEGGRIPDILISVVVRVHTKNGKMFVYSHRFLPKIVHITKRNNDLKEFYNRISDYANACKKKAPIIPIDNPGSISNVPNYHPCGSEYVAHYLKVLDKVINYKYTN